MAMSGSAEARLLAIMGGSATLVGMYGVIYFTGQRIAAVQMAEIAKQEQAQVNCNVLSPSQAPGSIPMALASAVSTMRMRVFAGHAMQCGSARVEALSCYPQGGKDETTCFARTRL